MADADALIAAALQQSECLPKNTDTTTWNVKDLDCDALVAIVCKCLARVQDAATDSQLDIALPASCVAPAGVAARHRLGSQLAGIFKALGYAGDCGYNHFLYPSEKETRSLLTWLVGKLPRTAVESNLDATSALPTGPQSNVQNDSLSVVAAAMAVTSSQASPSAALLAPEQLQRVFVAWKREKTLYVLPNRHVAQLRGFESLALQTAPVRLPWQQQQPSADTDGATDAFLFDCFPRAALKPASLLEALASSQRRSSQRIGLFEDDDDEHTALRYNAQIGGGGAAETAVSKLATAADAAAATRKSDVVDQDDWDDDDDDDATAAADREFGLLASPKPLTPVDPLESATQPLESLVLPPVSVSGDADALGSSVVAAAVATDSHGQSGHSRTEIESLTEEAELELLEQLRSQVAETQQRVTELRDVIAREQRDLDTLQRKLNTSKQRGLELKRSVATRQQTLAMLPQAKDNIAKLESICAASAEKLAQLEVEVAARRAPLVKEEAALRAVKSNRKARCRQLVLEMKSFRVEMKDMAAAVQRQMDSLRVLERTLAQLPTQLNRAMYTARILEIIKQVHKQKAEIAKVLDDIRAIQKQLNFASERLKRSEAVAEDKLYSAAVAATSGGSSSSRDSAASHPCVECYRRFAHVRELFEELIDVVGDVGRKENAARDLENWIAQLQSRDSGRHLDKVLADLESVQTENSAMTEQLRAQQQTAAVG